jgi:RES domain-containing protein
VQHPALIVQIELTGASLADLTAADVLKDLDIAPEVHDCQWRAEIDMDREPQTHALRKRLLEQGFDGVIYPSFMSRGGICVALWRWNEAGAPTLRAIDPGGLLPRNQQSWM